LHLPIEAPGLFERIGASEVLMDWMRELGGVLGRYEGANASNPPDSAHDDFDQVARSAPRPALADGLAAAFRSDQTPPFGQMVGQLFGNSPASQRASILSSLASAIGPALLSQILARHGSPPADVQGTQVSADLAQRVPPDAVREIAEQAEKKDPSIIDRISHAYAEQPQVVKTLGKAALAVALAQMVRKQYANR
jgi:hypothetical protein